MTDQENTAQYRALQHLVTYLLDGNMQKCMSTLSYALQEKKEAATESDMWDDSYHKFGKLPRYWLGNLLVKFTNFTESDILKLERHDSDNVRHVFEFLLAIDSNSPLPAPMLNKRVFGEACIARAKIVRRHETFKATAYNQREGSINWSKMWAYSLEFDEAGWLKACTHTGTKHTVTIEGAGKWHRKQWAVMHPMHDMQAHLASDDMKKYLHTFFAAAENKGPHTWKLPTKGKARDGPMMDLARAAVAKLDAVDRGVADSQISQSESLKEVAEQKRREKIQASIAKRKLESTPEEQKTKKAKALTL